MARVCAWLALLSCTYAGGQASTDERCHADTLISNVRVSALSDEEVQQMGRKAAQEIASATGHGPEEVSSRIFDGDYDLPWSPNTKRPHADLVLASIIANCTSPEAVLGVLRRPGFVPILESELTAMLVASPALTGKLQVLGVSVRPGSVTVAHQAPRYILHGSQERPQGSSSSTWFSWFAVLAVMGFGAFGLAVKKGRKDAREERCYDREFIDH